MGDNRFIEEIQGMVNINNNPDSRSDDIEYIDLEFERLFRARNAVSPITTKEQKAVLEAIAKEVVEKYNTMIAEREKENKKKEAENKEQTEQEKDGKKNPKEEPKKTEEKKKEIGYLDRAELVHNMKMEMLNNQITNNSYVPSDEEIYKLSLEMVLLENQRESYTKGMDETQLNELRTTEERYKDVEAEKEKNTEKKFNEPINELGELTKKLADVNKKIKEELQEFQKSSTNTDNETKEHDKLMKEYATEYAETCEQIAKLNPSGIMEDIWNRKRVDNLQEAIVGKEYMTNIYERSTDAEKKKIEVANRMKSQTAYDASKEDNVYKKNGPDEQLEMFKKHKKELEKQLKKLPKTIEKSEMILSLTRELATTDAKVMEYEANKAKAGSEKTPKDLSQLDENIEKKTKRINESYDKAKDAIKAIEKDGDKTLEEKINPERNSSELGTTLTFAYVAGVGDRKNITHEGRSTKAPADRATTGGIILGAAAINELYKGDGKKNSSKTTPTNELSDGYYNLNDPDDAKAYLEKMENIKKLNDKLQEIEMTGKDGRTQ